MPEKAEWHGWVKHLASSVWHQVEHSEDWDTVYTAVTNYVRQNKVIVKCHILMTGLDPHNLPSDYAAPEELRG